MKVLLVKRHIACTNGDDLWKKNSFSTHVISELRRFPKNFFLEIFGFTRFAYGLFTGVFGYFERTIG